MRAAFSVLAICLISIPAGAELAPPPGDGSHDAATNAAPAEPKTPKQTLDDLYARLAASTDADESSGLLTAIERNQLISGSDTSDFLMARALAALGAGSPDVALALLDQIVSLRPEWAEAWNRRATARFMQGDDEGSMADVAHVLALEPRHVGALSGMAMILERRGFDEEALRACRRALALAPGLKSLREREERLAKKTERQDL
jgi:tetratricopeptide (TPR) repeat protein